MNSYYVTNEGLAAGLANPSVLQTLKGILVGKAHPQTIRAFERKKLIAKDQREGERADHNMLILSGVVDRLRHIVVPEPPATRAASANDSSNGKGRKKPVTKYTLAEDKPQLTPTIQKVLDAFRSGAASVAELRASNPEIAAMNEGTLRWAIQQLRQRGLLASVTADLAAAS